MIQLVIINGLGGVGKSTFVTKCKEYAHSVHSDWEIEELSMVDYVKKIASICGWNGEKTNKDRTFLSNLKKALAAWNNSPFESVFSSIENFVRENPNKNFIFFINSREPEDIKAISNRAIELKYPLVKLIIKNPRVIVNEVEELIDGIENNYYDYTIINDGSMVLLEKKAHDFIDSLVI